MRVLLIGVDGRVYSMAKNMAEHGHTLAVIGGRAYMSRFFDTAIDAKPDSYTTIRGIANQFKPDLIVPVSYETGYAGVVDRLRADGFKVFGASYEGVRLEASKEHGLSVAQCMGISVAPFKMVSNAVQARLVAQDQDYRVVKRIGFAGGRGVKVCGTEQETVEQAIAVIEQDGTAMIQKRIDGVPVNIVWMQTLNGYVPICLQTDYKRTYSGDLGPFCGAMGATVWNHVPDRIVDEFIAPMNMYLMGIQYFGRVGLDCMYEPSTGKLYAIEWTARFGTPTTETLLETWDDDFAQLFAGWLDGDMNQPVKKGKIGLGVAIAGGGYPYPGAVVQGLPVTIEGEMDTVIPMGAAGTEGALVTKGGRHFIAVGHGDTIKEAQQSAYSAVKKVSFQDMFYRTDIGDDMLSGNVFEDLEERWS